MSVYCSTCNLYSACYEGNNTAATVKDLPIFLHPLQWKTSGTRSAKCHYVSLVMFLLKSSVVSSFHLKLYFLTTAADLYKPRLFHVTCLQLFSLQPEEQHPEEEINVQPDIEPSPPTARPKKMRQQGMFQCLYPGCTKSVM